MGGFTCFILFRFGPILSWLESHDLEFLDMRSKLSSESKKNDKAKVLKCIAFHSLKLLFKTILGNLR